jgi:hypothetical protein
MMFFEMRYKNYSPWIWKFVHKDDDCIIERTCSICGKKWSTQKNDNYYDRSFEALLDKSGNKWTDLIGSGEGHFTLFSQRVLDIFESENIGKFPAFSVKIIPPYPKKITEPPPLYYRLDYKRMEKAEMDWKSSGFVDARICPECGLCYNWNMYDKLTKANIVSYKLQEKTWQGADIFYVRFSHNIYCTEKVVDCAVKYKLTNFRFVPLEIAGSATAFRGVDYMAKNWRAKIVKQIEEFRNNFRPFDYETGQYVK